jgi:hypothetical protein
MYVYRVKDYIFKMEMLDEFSAFHGHTKWIWEWLSSGWYLAHSRPKHVTTR